LGAGEPVGADQSADETTTLHVLAAGLSRATALLEAIGETSSDPIYAKDVDGRFFYANSAVLAIIGKSADDVLGHTELEFHSDLEQAAAVMANDRRIMQTGIPEIVEETWDAAGLGARTYRSTKKPLYHDDGSLIGIMGLSADITAARAEREALAALREREQRLNAFLENSAVVAWLKDEEGRYVFLSDNYQRQVGLRPDDVMGKTDFEVWPRAVADAFKKNDYVVLAAEAPIEAVEPAPNPDGGVTWWLTNKFTYRDSMGRRYVGGLGVDVTARIKTETALRESEARMRLAQDATHSGFWEWTVATNRHVWSENLWRLHGLDATGQEASHELWMQCVHPDDRARMTQAMDAKTAAGEELELSWRVNLPDGAPERWLLARGRPLMGADGKPERYIGIVIDITEQKQAESAMERMRQALGAGRVATWKWDVATDACIWNDEHYHILGYEPGSVTPNYEAWARRVLPEDLPPTEARNRAMIERGDEYLAQYRVLGKNDEVRWLEARGQRQVNKAGHVSAIGVAMDITDRKRAEAALRESEERFRALFENMQDGCAYCRMVYDDLGQPLDFVYLAVNPAFYRLTGLEGAVGKRITEVLPNVRELFPKVIETYGRVARSGLPERFEIAFTPMASWLAISAYCPSPDHFVAMFDDITERKRAEDALVTSEKQLKAFLENSALIAWLKDEECRVVLLSENFQRRFGVRLEDAIGKTDFDLFPRAAAEVYRQSDLAALAAEAPTEYLESAPKPDGEASHWLINKFTYRDSMGRRYVGGMGVDITARVAAEEALRKSEARLQRYYDSKLLGLFHWNMNGQVVEANDKFLEMIGYERDDLAAGQIDWKKLIPPELADVHQHCLTELMATGANSAPFEKEYIRKDGSRLPILFAAAMLDETRTEGVAFVVDITERKKAQEALAVAKAEAERANIAKSKFLAAASHDLRQPLQSLTALLRAIEIQSANKQNTDRAMKKAQDAVRSLNGLLNGILDIARLDAGVVEPVKTSVDVGELLMRLAEEYHTRAAAKGLALRFTPCALRAHTDATLLERMIRNLIENALRYTSVGGILIGVRRRGATARLDIIDTGIGVPADKQGEIFEEFHQLNNPGRDSSRGLGLGLAIVSRLAKLLEVEVQMRSNVGRGSRFSLFLPLERTTPAPVETKPAVCSPGGRILVIDDDEVVCEAHTTLLECMGYEVLGAETGEKALELAERENWRFDAILADYRLGAGLTGTAAAAEISRRAGRAIPTVILTGDTAIEPIREVSSSGFTMLHKPTDPDELLETLASLLSGEPLRSTTTAD